MSTVEDTVPIRKNFSVALMVFFSCLRKLVR